MDVPYAWSDLGRIAARAAILSGPEGVKQFHPAACCLDGDRIGIHVSDGGHDVIELRIAHMGVNAGGIINRTGGQPEARDCPAQGMEFLCLRWDTPSASICNQSDTFGK